MTPGFGLPARALPYTKSAILIVLSRKRLHCIRGVMDAVHKFCNVIYGDKKQCEDGTHNIGQETDTMRRNVTSHRRQDRPRRVCLLYIHAHIFVSFIERAR